MKNLLFNSKTLFCLLLFVACNSPKNQASRPSEPVKPGTQIQNEQDETSKVDPPDSTKRTEAPMPGTPDTIKALKKGNK